VGGDVMNGPARTRGLVLPGGGVERTEQVQEGGSLDRKEIDDEDRRRYS